MDISAHISELLFEHDCIIIPGFGGLVCSYAHAEIHPIENTISPPSKAISFNRNLQNNDGLLVNYLVQTENLSFDAATDFVTKWVDATKAMLNSGEVVIINKVGRFHNDIENNLQFKVDSTVNYLKASYGLRTVTAYPVISRQRTLPLETEETASYEEQAPVKRSQWKVAAIIVLMLCLGALAQLMWMGVEVKPLHLNEAGVMGFLNNIFKTTPVEVEPIEITETTNEAPSAETPASVTEPAAVTEPATAVETATNTSTEQYYIIIGAFKRGKNIDAAKADLAQQHGDSNVLIDNNGSLTRIGYFAGNTEAAARKELDKAKGANADAWLFKK